MRNLSSCWKRVRYSQNFFPCVWCYDIYPLI